MGADNVFTSCDLRILVEEAAKPVVSLNGGGVSGDAGQVDAAIAMLDDEQHSVESGLSRVIPACRALGWMITNERPAGSTFKQQRGGGGQMETARMPALQTGGTKINNSDHCDQYRSTRRVIPRN